MILPTNVNVKGNKMKKAFALIVLVMLVFASQVFGASTLIASRIIDGEAYANAAAADQGATGTRTIKALEDDATVKTIILADTTGGGTTYTLTTSETITKKFVVMPGVVINGAGTLTLNSEFDLADGAIGTVTLAFGASAVGRYVDSGVQKFVGPAEFAGSMSMTNTVSRTLAQLKSLSTPSVAGYTTITSCRATAGDDGGGEWRWDSTDLSAEVAADTQNGIYVPPNSDASGASGAWVRIHDGIYRIKWYGPVEGADSTVALQAAVSASTGAVLFWEGSYIITTSLDATERGSTPTTWVGRGFNADMSSDEITCRTASDGTSSAGWIADFTGSQNVSIRDMNFVGSGANASTKGFLFARSETYQYAQQHKLDRVVVKLGTAPAATSLGSIAIVNNQAEQMVIDHCSLYADTPALFCLSNDITLVSPHGLIYNTIKSTTSISVRDTTFYAYTQSAIVGYGVAGSEFSRCVYAADAGNTTQYAITLLTSSGAGYQYPQDLSFSGQIEGFDAAISFGSASMSSYNVSSDLFLVAPGAAYIVTAASVSLYGCDFNNSHVNNLSGQTVFSGGSGSSVHGGSIKMYPSDSAPTGATFYGTAIDYDGAGLGLLSIVAGTDMSGLGAPNAPVTRLSNQGKVFISGILQAGDNVTAGNTVGTVNAAHRPNRTVYGACFISGIGLSYYTLTSGGALSVGSNLINGSQVSLEGITYSMTN